MAFSMCKMVLLTLGAAFAAASLPAFGGPTYTITDPSTLGGTSCDARNVNSHNDVVGSRYVPGNSSIKPFH